MISVAFLTSPEYIPYSEGSVAIREIGNGMVLAEFDDTVYGYDINRYPADDGLGYIYHITTWNRKNARTVPWHDTIRCSL